MKLCSVWMTGFLLIGMMHPCYAKPIDRTHCELKQQEFLQHLQNAERDLAIARTQYMDEHPRVQELERQREKFTKLLKQNLEYCSPGQSKTPNSSPSESIMGL
jgi:nicotinamide riboside kinase